MIRLTIFVFTIFFNFSLSAKEINFKTVDNATIYAEFQKRGSHAVLLAHGAIFNKESWGNFKQLLLEENYTVLAIDFRGYGKSTQGNKAQALYEDILAGVQFLNAEQDISKISVDDKVEITLDAFSDDVKFYGKVFSIEPAETVIQDVIYYNVTISCEFSDEYFDKVKPGMTANVIITTVERDNVLTAPTRAIVNKNGEGKVLRILKNGIMQEIPIEVGIRGDEGVIEVLSGVEDGTEVVVYIKEKK